MNILLCGMIGIGELEPVAAVWRLVFVLLGMLLTILGGVCYLLGTFTGSARERYAVTTLLGLLTCIGVTGLELWVKPLFRETLVSIYNIRSLPAITDLCINAINGWVVVGTTWVLIAGGVFYLRPLQILGWEHRLRAVLIAIIGLSMGWIGFTVLALSRVWYR